MKILLIEDDEWVRDSLRLFFESENCLIVALETAEEGLQALANQDFDIILIDYRLPGLDGLEFLRLIQKTHSAAMKILITAYGSEELVAEARKLGINDYIPKPFTSEAIEASLNRLIQSRDKNYTSI
ncbi:MAG: response regulator [Desulfobacterales bacterium]